MHLSSLDLIMPSAKPSKRLGPPTTIEKALIAQVVADSPQEITERQVRGLAAATRRSPDAIRNMIVAARERFVERAQAYMDIHKAAVDMGLASETLEGAKLAIQGSQWALEHMRAEGEAVIEPEVKQQAGGGIQIGIKVGGANPAVGVRTNDGA